MTIAKFYFNAQEAKAIPSLISRFPESIRPSHFGDSEEKSSPRYPLSVSGAKEVLQRRGKSGYLLFGEDITYSFRPATIGGFGELFVSGERTVSEAHALERLTHVMADSGVEFGFVAKWEEHLHRNQYVYKLPNGSVEAWVGRDLSKYLPGLYWLTILRTYWATKYKIDKYNWPTPIKTLDFGPRYLALQLFNQPEDWMKHAEQIDSLCEKSEGIFSIRRARNQLGGAKNYIDFTQRVENWR